MHVHLYFVQDEYTVKSNSAHPENFRQQELDTKVLYDVSGGMQHGRVAIANGAVRKVDVLSASKEKTIASSNSVSYRCMTKENQRLRHANRCLHERVDQLGELTNDLIMVLILFFNLIYFGQDATLSILTNILSYRICTMI